ncbi:dicarboxylate/amino acid:cation symporter [Nocardioides carbamazepini]|uniref:dicarboxylate/amino acid:cation symporter n=1 Tax=Nocardioides carbamazepini TaxID=2854259 RepID=UPI002149ED0A|nr:dicarboxylate/amino acid:cation symporter [Nocardioides carbamazepini]MCR1781498.1 dicarboxylate/amino acid:cation symporter [Nocardioides carbamazepini]
MGGYAVTALLVTLGLFAGIYVLGRLRVNFSVLTIAALGLGVGVGVVFEGHLDYVEPVGKVYLNLLLAIVAPLIIVSILSSITSLGTTAQLRTIGARSVGWLLGLNALAVLLTLGLALQLGIGRGAGIEVGERDTSALENIKKPFSEVFIDFFPTNIVTDIAETNVIPIILFSVLIAVSYSLVADRAPATVAPFKGFIDALREIIYRAVGFVIALTPYAVLSLTAVATARAAGQWSQMVSLLGVLGLAWLACFVHAFMINGVLLRVFADVDPVLFFRKILPAQVTAFTTQSSAGTLPVTTRLLRERVGVPSDIAGFTAPLGTTIGMPGCAGVWPVLLAVFGVNALGISWGVQDYLVLILLGVIVSVGTAGVPGTATITATTVLTAAGLPLELVAITLPVSMVADMARTLDNVTSAAVAATIVARQEGRLDDAVFDGTALPADSPDDLADDLAGQVSDDVFDDVLLVDPGVPIGACALPTPTRTPQGVNA